MAKKKTEETTALTVFQQFDIVTASADLKEALEANLGGEAIDDSLLSRIKCPSGGATIWSIPDVLGGESHVETFEGVIIHSRMSRAFWRDPYTGGGTPPDCYSNDMNIGIGDPGGECESCPMNEFGSDPNKETQAKACSESRLLFVLLPDDQTGVELMPTVLKVPPASLRNSKKFLLHLATKTRAKMWGVLTEFSLTKERNAKGMDYAEIHFKPKGVFDPKVTADFAKYRDDLLPMLDRAADAMTQQRESEEEVEPI